MNPRSPVLLIHGIDDTAALFDDMTAHLEAGGRRVCRLNLVPNDGGAGLDVLAGQVASFAAYNFAADRSFDLVGFSMGGLVARYYLQRLGGIDRAGRFISIATPHRGTVTGFLRSNPGARQMRPGSPFLKDLNNDVAMLKRVHFTSIWSPFDLMIVPARSSILPAARMIEVKVPIHPWMVRDRGVLSLVEKILDEEARPIAYE